MKRWPMKYRSRLTFLIEWCDTPPSEARRIVEKEIAEDVAFEKRAAA